MNQRLTLIFLALFLSLFAVVTVNAHHEPATNKDGSVVTNVLTASWDPFGQSSGRPVTPFPSNLFYFGLDAAGNLLPPVDLTLNTPVDDPNDYSNPRVALNALDGFSPTEKWVTSFAANPTGAYDNNTPGLIDPASVTTGKSVRMFEVTMSQFLFVTGIVRELTPGVDYVAVPASESQIAILPLKPLKEYTSYMAVLTNDIRDTQGNDATPDRTYGFGKTSVPWVDANGQSTNALFDDGSAATLELIRQVIQSMELNVAAYTGLNPDDIVFSWTAQTQSVTRTLKTLRAFAQPAPTMIAPTGLNTSNLVPGSPGAADVSIGVITVPYYAGIPSAENPIAPLNTFWKAAPGAYVPPFDQFGLDPTSTNITVANPIPVVNGMQTVPLMITVPRGQVKPANGWPVVIFGHGITRSRLDLLAAADGFAAAGYAAVAMDFPMHGISPDATPQFADFWVENTPFAPIANERTFDVDYISNTTGAPGPDGLIDASGAHAISAGLSNMLVGRDTIRQGIADLSVLAVSIGSMDFDGDGSPDTDASNIAYAGQSWGGIHGTVFTAIEPLVTRSVFSVPGGGIARFAEASEAFGPVIRAGLAANGIFPGTSDYESFFLVWQTVLDSADPINWAAEAAANTPILLHEVINDSVIPNYVPTSPLAGTEPLIKVMGLESYSTTQQSATGLRAAGRFVPPATHGSWLDPTSSPAAFFEMQSQAATFIGSFGGAVVVNDGDTMVPVMQMNSLVPPVADLTEKKGAGVKKGTKPTKPVNRPETVRRPAGKNQQLNSFE
jgi:pimeloyl-ACP methyl ester carboxylesterase